MAPPRRGVRLPGKIVTLPRSWGRWTSRAGFGVRRWIALALPLVLGGGWFGVAGSHSQPSRAPGADATSRARAERALVLCANRVRSARGLRRLKRSEALSAAARMHARNMARRHFFGHTDRRGRGPAARVARFDQRGRYRYIAENIAGGQRTVRSACRAWTHSPGHRANILGPGFTNIGAGFNRGGRWRRYYVQVFARRG